MRYEKKVRYLDYYEGGQRAGGGGFAKLEARDGRLRMELSVSGHRPTDSFVRDVALCGGGKEGSVGRIELAEGRGRFSGQWQDMENIGGSGIAYGELDGIRILLGAGREVSCRWQAAGLPVLRGQAAAQGRSGEKGSGEPQGEVEAEEIPAVLCGEEWEAASDSASETAEGSIDADGDGEYVPQDTVQGRDMAQERGTVQGRDMAQGRAADHPISLMEDKWLQLWEIYPHIRPFQDGREYLSISPSDFVLFPEPAYRTVNNSFLLHGYYNYRHLILARAERKGEQRYYIGVPGSFYEREKQVAIMFGFESFECAEEPAQPGDFGYYMMRTQI